MKWEKRGLIYCPDGTLGWAKYAVMTPTPIILGDKIRIYCGFRDNDGVSRIGYIDVCPENPLKVINISSKPVLDIGENGHFDDNGMILGDVLQLGEEIWMYYVGFQKVNKVKFLAYSGLAISSDGGESFKRFSTAPVMDRTDNAKYIRAIHTVLKLGERFQVWYSVGNGWETINGILYPCYDIRYTESSDGITFEDRHGIHCLGVENNEYRIGRPRVKSVQSGYEMRFTFDTRDKHYGTGLAFSEDGKTWERKNNLSGIEPSESGWDSEMICYPVEINVNGKQFIFYSGNGMGATGVGYAELRH